MIGLINPDSSTASSDFDDMNGHVLNGSGSFNGYGNVGGNGSVKHGPPNNTGGASSIVNQALDGQSNDHSLNGDPYTPDEYDTTNKTGSCEPIAIIGMGCRLPGGGSSSSKLWDLLIAGISAQGRFPSSRFNIDGFYHPNGDRPGSLNTAGGYFIDEDLRAFENSFFGINNLEATFMDPQQRKLLEVVFECFENAGVSLEQLSGANVGCYVGNFVTDFITMQLKDAEYTHRYTATGLGTTILANRISHVFNLKGPSFVIDTACSSSLYCLHAACSALLSRDCDSAIVAGANLIQSPEQQLATMKAGVLSKTSTCHTFDSSADGYGRGDGIGALFVKRLSDAIRDGDPVRAVIRGTAVNSNGRTNGITLPSADGQEAVIRKAYARAGLGYGETDYVECHGTGTAVGDPIEVEATSRVFKRSQAPPLLIGSVKTNLGHSEAASGISSIIKVVLALEKGEIPPTIGVKNTNPKIKLDEWNIKIVTEKTPWPSNSPHNVDGRVRRAGVNSFGYGGANSHVIIDAAEMHLPPGYMTRSSDDKGTASARAKMLIPFSASNSTALQRRITDLALLDLHSVSTIDLAYTLGVRRSHLPVRGYALVRPGSLKEDLTLDNTITRVEGRTYSKLPLAFVFTGQGAQWPEMGRELLAEFPTFRRTIQMLDSTLQLLPHPPTWTLLGTLLETAETSMINHASRSQPICTAVQIGLVRLLYTFGIIPESVLGHSSGEIAAAYASGYLTAEQAISIAYYRGYTVTRSSKATIGAMMAAGLGLTDANENITALGLGNKVNVACVNSPESVTISGDVDGIESLKAHLDRLGIFARLLKTDGKAYHSHHMAAVGEEYEQHLISASSMLESVAMNNRFLTTSLDATWISSVNGEVVDDDSIGLSYWRANLESPVLFENAVGKLLQDVGSHHLVEIGPHSALELPIKQICAELNISKEKVHYSTALSRGKDSVTTVLKLVGDLYLHGHTVSFQDVNIVGSRPSKADVLSDQRQGSMLLDLPKYCWDYDPQQELFNESRLSVEWRNRKYPRHDLLGSQVHGGNGILASWRNVLKAKDIPWVDGHKLDTAVVFPAAGYLAMAIEAITQVKGLTATTTQGSAFAVQDVHITKALVLPQQEDGLDTGVELFTTLQPAHLLGRGKQEWQKFNISSYVLGEATTHATGLIQLRVGSESEKLAALPVIEQKDMEPTAPRTWYNKFSEGGLNFQGQFQSLTQIHVHAKRRETKVLASTELLQGGGHGPTMESDYVIHPVTIDTLFQAGIIASTGGVVRELRAKVPVHIEQMLVRAPLPNQSPVTTNENINITSVSEPSGFGSIRVSGELYDNDKLPLLTIKGCRLIPYQSGIQQQDQEDRHPMLRVMWKPDITKLGQSNGAELSYYIAEYVKQVPITGIGEHGVAIARLGAVLDLLVHKNPKIRILTFLGNEADDVYLMENLRFATAFKRCQSLWRASCADNGTLEFEDLSSDGKSSNSSGHEDMVFDVVLLGPRSRARMGEDLAAIKDSISPNGMVLCVGSSDEIAQLETLGFEKSLQSQLGGRYEAMISRLPSTDKHPGENIDTEAGEVLIVQRNATHSLNEALVTQIQSMTGRQAKRVALEQVTPDLLKAHKTVITTIELEESLLSCISEEEMRHVKTLTDNCTDLIWVTGGRLLQGSRPEMGIVFGLSRALMLEQPSLRFFVIDVDVGGNAAPSETTATAVNIVKVLKQAVEEPEPDFEFIDAAGMLHVSRFVPAEALNTTFREKQGVEKRSLTLSEAQPCRLDTEIVGQTDSIFFRRGEAATEPSLAAGCVELSVQTVGLNIRDLHTISGNAQSSSDKTCASQYGGVVSRVGAGVKHLVPGDRVVAMASGYFSTQEYVPEWACCKLDDGDDLKTLTTLLVPLSTAIHVIHDRARLQANDSVLIYYDSHSSDAGAGLAAIRLTQLVGAQVFVVCTSTEDRDELPQKFGLSQDQFFMENDAALATKLMPATKHRGVNVIVAFTDNDLPPALSGSASIGNICADGARLVQVGVSSSGLVDAVIADPTVLRRNITLATFDVGSLLARQTPDGEALRRELLAKIMSLYRSGELSAIDFSPRVWDISEVGEAFRALASDKDGRRYNGGVVVSLENKKSLVPVMPIKFDTRLSAEKTYLLVGCLGGLGRSMSKWMLERGARKFVFMGRSGMDKAPARRLVENLQSLGAQVTVVRGDVVNAADVNRAVAGIDGPIGGVIQAAMGLDEALFTTMPRDYWLAGLKPKVTGSWNLYNALSGRAHDMDFFLMTSSVSGSVGTATESNYCSANYFLDVFARYCRGVGIPAVSVGLGMISEVGYLHENPEIEALLLRKGIQAINEDEMLQIIDISLSAITTAPTGPEGIYDEFALSHVLTGLEPLGLKALRAKGFEGSSPVLGDPRAFLLSAALDEATAGAGSSSSTGGLTAEMAEDIEAGSTVEEAVLKTVSQKFSSLVLIPKDKLDVTKPISSVGVDSMLAAEFRAWIFQAFKVDVPYLTLLSPVATLVMLGEMITQKITEAA